MTRWWHTWWHSKAVLAVITNLWVSATILLQQLGTFTSNTNLCFSKNYKTYIICDKKKHKRLSKDCFAHRTMGAIYPWCSSDMLGCSSRRLHHCQPWESPSHKLPQVAKCTVHCMALQFIMSNFAGALDNLQAFRRVKTCLASSGCVMAREVLGPMNILNMRGFLGKSERLHKTQTTVLDMLSFARLSRLRQRLMTEF